MKWPTLQDDKVAVTQAVADVYKVREKKKSALRRLAQALDEVKIDDGLVKIGDDLLKGDD